MSGKAIAVTNGGGNPLTEMLRHISIPVHWVVDVQEHDFVELAALDPPSQLFHPRGMLDPTR
jgi:hypothetical protein